MGGGKGVVKIEGDFYEWTTTPECSEDRTAVPSVRADRPDSHSLRMRVWPPRLQSRHACWMVKMESELLCMHTTCVHVPHTHISVSEVGSRSLWGTYPGVLSDTPTECVTQCAIVPCLKQNTRHHAPCTKQDMCVKPDVIPLTPQGHFVPQLYHRTAKGLSSLKTSSSIFN